MSATVTNILSIGIDTERYQRLVSIADRERISVSKVAALALETYLGVLSDEAIVDQLRGMRPVPQTA